MKVFLLHSPLSVAAAFAATVAFAASASAATPRLGACAHVTRDEFADRVRTFQMMRADGFTDLAEYGADTDPLDPASLPPEATVFIAR